MQIIAGNFAQDFQKASELNRQGKYQEAINAFEELLKLKERRHADLKKDEIYYELALCYYKEKNLDQRTFG